MRSSFVISLSPFVLLAAAACDLAFGDPRNLPHPVVYIGRLISWLEPRLRSLFRNEKAAGVLLVVATVGGTYLFARFFLAAAFAIHHAVGVVVAVWMTFTALAARSLHTESAAVARLVEEGNLIEARQRLAWIVGRDTENLDEQEILRALVETVAENTSDGVIAPLFYLMLGGAALGLAYKAVNTLDSMVGYKNDRYLHFGWASARFDDIVNYIPARLTGVLMVCVSPLVGLSGFRALTIMLRDGRNHSSPNSGIPEAAAAGAIGVMLGGTNYYFGKPISKPTIGDSLKPLTLESYRQVVRLMYGSAGLLIVLFLLFS